MFVINSLYDGGLVFFEFDEGSIDVSFLYMFWILRNDVLLLLDS